MDECQRKISYRIPSLLSPLQEGGEPSDDTAAARAPEAATAPISQAPNRQSSEKQCHGNGPTADGETIKGSELSPDDILLGRGVPMQRHPGNIRMHHLINSYRPRYRKATRIDKASMIQEVLQKLKEGGVKFRKRVDNEDLWVEVGDQVAYDKISHALRGRGSERRAPPRESLSHLAGDLSVSPAANTLEEGKGNDQQDVINDSKSVDHSERKPPPAAQTGASDLSNLSFLGVGTSSLSSAGANSALERLLECRSDVRPEIALLLQGNEAGPASVSTHTNFLGLSLNHPSPAAATDLSAYLRPTGSSGRFNLTSGGLPNALQSQSPLSATTTDDLANRRLIQVLLLQRLLELQQQQQQILSPTVNALIDRLRITSSASGTLQEQLRLLQLQTAVSSPSESSSLLTSLRDNNNLDLNSSPIQSILQQQPPSQNSALLETLTRRNSAGFGSGIMQANGIELSNAHSGLSLGLQQNFNPTQQQDALLQSVLAARAAGSVLGSTQQISNRTLLSLLTQQPNTQQLPNPDQQRN
jgi:hypothetical protein